MAVGGGGILFTTTDEASPLPYRPSPLQERQHAESSSAEGLGERAEVGRRGASPRLARVSDDYLHGYLGRRAGELLGGSGGLETLASGMRSRERERERERRESLGLRETRNPLLL